jgi:hypothetical protein
VVPWSSGESTTTDASWAAAASATTASFSGVQPPVSSTEPSTSWVREGPQTCQRRTVQCSSRTTSRKPRACRWPTNHSSNRSESSSWRATMDRLERFPPPRNVRASRNGAQDVGYSPSSGPMKRSASTEPVEVSAEGFVSRPG